MNVMNKENVLELFWKYCRQWSITLCLLWVNAPLHTMFSIIIHYKGISMSKCSILDNVNLSLRLLRRFVWVKGNKQAGLSSHDKGKQANHKIMGVFSLQICHLPTSFTEIMKDVYTKQDGKEMTGLSLGMALS